jgi:PAS domain S-box-containing protein
MITGAYDSALVALSFAVACFASYTALDLGTRIRASRGLARSAWLATAAVAMGGGIWSMHFIAMLAFIMPMPVSYDIGLTILSLLVAIGVTGFGFYVIGTRQATALQLAMSGLFMGLGIVSMHYTGMAAMRMSAHLRYDPALVGLSVLIAVGASMAALWLTFRTALVWQRALAAVVMGIAISGMHYTGMAAAMFTAHSHADEVYASNSLAQTNLALAIAGITFIILVLALVASIFDRQFAVLADRETSLLRQSEEQFRKLYRETPLPLHSLNSQGSIEKVSDAWVALMGCAREEAIGRNLTEFMTLESKARYEEIAWPSLHETGEIREAEFQFVRKSGEVLDVLLSAHLDVTQKQSPRTLGGLIDVTARKRAEEAMRQSQRMEAIGQLTGGVAHDFNNLLMVISGATEKLRRTLADPNAAGPLEMIATAVERGQTLTGHLLSFSRRQTLDVAVMDLTELLPTFSEMLRRSLRGDIEIRTSASGHLCRVRVDRAELELALLNLGVNARDAMPAGGVLSVTIRQVVLGGDPATDGLRGEFVEIDVEDTGTGVAPEILPRVFEPFFTTKGVGKGTGLGLSHVYGFAKQSGGTATILSKPGKGTTVKIYLPMSDESVSVEQPAGSPSEEPIVAEPAQFRKGTVLLVEDTPEVAEVATEYLQELGYAVDHVTNGSDALQKLGQGHAYVLVFSDILMPGRIGGLELGRIVQERHPNVPILLTTGYSERTQDAAREGLSILLKPYNLRTLSEAIQELHAGSSEHSPGNRLARTGTRS